MQVCLIIGIAGACRSDELVNLKTKDVEEHGKLFLIKIAGNKFKKSRSFTITPEYSDKVRIYRDMRPKKTVTDRFFVNFQKGKCTVQVIGKNKFASMPKQIAAYLNLKNPELYTGHAFRRTSSALQKEAGSNILDLLTECGVSKKVPQQIADNLSNVKFEEVLIPYQDSDEEYEIVPMKQPKLEMDLDLKDGSDPLEKMF